MDQLISIVKWMDQLKSAVDMDTSGEWKLA